jgi:hypothetical protein
MLPSQKLRISVGNAAGSPNRLIYVYSGMDPGGDPLFESERIEVPSGEFRSSDISYSALAAAGEPGTGRVQMMVKLVVELPAGLDPSAAICWLELIDEETGATSVHRRAMLNAWTANVCGAGLVPEQTARLSVSNLNAEAGSQPVRVQAYTYDMHGNLLSQTAPAELPAGQSCILDVDRAALPAAGEPGTGRLQVLVRVQLWSADGSVRILPESYAVSLEVFDNRSGKATYQTGSIGWIKVSPDA